VAHPKFITFGAFGSLIREIKIASYWNQKRCIFANSALWPNFCQKCY